MENKETLEEVAKRLYPNGCDGTDRSAEIYRRIFIEGAKWQQKRSYSEEEMIDLIQFLSMNEEFNGYGSVSEKTAKHFLEQFKKK